MAALIARVRVLERRAGVAGTCPACDGCGTPAFQVRMDGERCPPVPRGCPRCGVVSVLRVLIIDGPDHVEPEPVMMGRRSVGP